MFWCWHPAIRHLPGRQADEVVDEPPDTDGEWFGYLIFVKGKTTTDPAVCAT